MAKAYSTQIKETTNHTELKAVGSKIYEAKLSKDKRNQIIKLYKTRLRELDRAMIDASQNTKLKKMLYEINNMAKEGVVKVAQTGKNLYQAVKDGVFNKTEADLLFRAYGWQKHKAGIIIANKGDAALNKMGGGGELPAAA